MLSVLRNAWVIPEVRRKLLFTMMIIIVFRIGSAIPVPFLDAGAISGMFTSTNAAGNFLGYLDILTGGGFSKATVFALSITPYINASIIMQLLAVAIPALERMQKEGEEGRKKVAKITRYVTVLFGLLLGFAYFLMLRNGGAVKYTTGFSGFFVATIIVMVFAAGSALIMWLGEQINEKGIGNGISIILFAGIVSRGPALVGQLLQWWGLKGSYYIYVPLYVVLALVAVVFVVIMTNAERRIPVQYAQRVVGRKVYGGQSTHIPIKVNMSGVMPIIFASSFISIPGIITSFFPPKPGGFWSGLLSIFNYTHPFYAIIYLLLIVAFNYFYVSIQYNPLEIANNLKKNSGSVPGIRPGKPTSDFIGKIVRRITLIGAIFLGIVAVGPIFLTMITKVNIALGGTTLLIVVGVALETVHTLESQMMMRHYKGFLE